MPTYTQFSSEIINVNTLYLFSYNIFGHRVLIPAALTYVLYVGSFLSKSNEFTIAAGVILGVGAGFLWTAQAGIMMSYPSEKDKGKAFSLFWMVFNL